MTPEQQLARGAMCEKFARRILGRAIQRDNRLNSHESEGDVYGYLYWPGDGPATLDGRFPAVELAAIAWWIDNMKVQA